MSFKMLMYTTLEADNPGPRTRFVRLTVALLIVANVVSLVVESHLAPSDPSLVYFDGFEVVSVVIFTVEYLLRVWSITARSADSRPVLDRLRFALTPLAVLDLLAIVPFYLTSFFVLDLRVVRLLRLLRLTRLFKLGRYSQAMQQLARVVKATRAELLSALAVCGVLLLFSSALMYYAEREAQPLLFPNISAALWWGIATLTTVGYGDVVPVTVIGKLLGAAVAVLGLGVVALPSGIIASGFVSELRGPRAFDPNQKCPHCGESLDPESLSDSAVSDDLGVVATPVGLPTDSAVAQPKAVPPRRSDADRETNTS